MIRTVVVLALCVSMVSPLVAANRFVDDDAPPGGSGLDWDSPFDNLESALALRNVDEIHVAGGTYVPTKLAIEADDRSARYEIRDGVHIRGGYAGYDAKDPDLNDPVTYPTILSGDLAGDDEDDFKNRDDNAYHVLAAEDLEEGTVLEGLIIQAGNADGKGDARKGGGVFLDQCVIEIIDCKFFDNWAELFGGSIFAEFGNVTVTGCTFEGSFSEQSGSAIFSGDMTVTGCDFTDNEAAEHGGAVYIRQSGEVTFTGCRFESNVAGFNGGAVNVNKARVEFIDCDFVENEALGSVGSVGFGGGIFTGLGAVNLVDCRFIGNRAERDGGGARLRMIGADHMLRCEFRDNESSRGSGGGVWATYSGPYLIEFCIFANNNARFEGGGLWGSVREVTNCTFVGNDAQDAGGGIAPLDSDDILVNCIFWANTDVTGTGESSQILTRIPRASVTYSLVEGGWKGTGNIEDDPLFIDEEVGDFRLTLDSPALDAGDPDSPIDEDGTTADMGALPRLQDGAFLRGDCTLDARVDIADGITIIRYLFLKGSTPGCLRACDLDSDLRVGIGDAMFVFDYFFEDGPAPSAPFPDCGAVEEVEPGCEEPPECLP